MISEIAANIEQHFDVLSTFQRGNRHFIDIAVPFRGGIACMLVELSEQEYILCVDFWETERSFCRPIGIERIASRNTCARIVELVHSFVELRQRLLTHGEIGGVLGEDFVRARGFLKNKPPNLMELHELHPTAWLGLSIAGCQRRARLEIDQRNIGDDNLEQALRSLMARLIETAESQDVEEWKRLVDATVACPQGGNAGDELGDSIYFTSCAGWYCAEFFHRQNADWMFSGLIEAAEAMRTVTRTRNMVDFVDACTMRLLRACRDDFLSLYDLFEHRERSRFSPGIQGWLTSL